MEQTKQKKEAMEALVEAKLKEGKEKLSEEKIKLKTEMEKVGILHSISGKVALIIFASVMFAIIICIRILVPQFSNYIVDMTESNMLNVVSLYSERLNVEIESGNTDENAYSDLLKGVKVKGADTAYAYLVDENGIMLYHPTASKIGAPVENEVVKGLVAELKSGKIPANDVTDYVFNGVKKYAGYTILSNRSILVISADESEILMPVTKTQNLAIVVGVFVTLLFTIVGFLISLWITKPLNKIMVIVDQTAKFNFVKNSNSGQLRSRKDETGLMARSVHEMRKSLRDMVNTIVESSYQIENNVNQLNKISSEINEKCMDNSAITEEIAAGMEETSATTETINSSIEHMQSGAQDIKHLSIEGEQFSEKVLVRAEELEKTTNDATNRTQQLYSNVKLKTEKAIEDSKAVDKINELTAAIMAVSSQTRLLALNASIEAARAGEAGRGFAVVATEIGSLANQTAQTVGDIDEIVKEVNGAVANMSDSLKETVSFLEMVVLKDYGQFNEVSKQYSSDAGMFKSNMKTIYEAINTLSDTIHTISSSLQGINSTINESTIGVSEIAGKTTDVVIQTEANYKLVNECGTQVDKLKETVSIFSIE